MEVKFTDRVRMVEKGAKFHKVDAGGKVGYLAAGVLLPEADFMAREESAGGSEPSTEGLIRPYSEEAEE
jgi:hypothetical protein